jgi:hypothetical protein
VACGYHREMHRVVVGIALALAAQGCALDKHRYDRPARLQLGANARSFAAPAPGGVALRQTETPAVKPEAGATGTGRFTMSSRHHLYFGGELESGAFADGRFSSIAGAYGIGGIEATSRFGALGVELAGGLRSLRYGGDGPRDHQLVAEPRVRGQLWVSSQFTLGATLGTTLDRDSWVAGVFLGVHSRGFDVFGDN